MCLSFVSHDAILELTRKERKNKYRDGILRTILGIDLVPVISEHVYSELRKRERARESWILEVYQVYDPTINLCTT